MRTANGQTIADCQLLAAISSTGVPKTPDVPTQVQVAS